MGKSIKELWAEHKPYPEGQSARECILPNHYERWGQLFGDFRLLEGKYVSEKVQAPVNRFMRCLSYLRPYYIDTARASLGRVVTEEEFMEREARALKWAHEMVSKYHL